MKNIPIRKEIRKKDNEEIEIFIVPAISFFQADGQLKKYPHPEGNDTMVFQNMDKALEAVNRAGYDDSIPDYTPLNNGNLSPNLNNISSHLVNALKDKSSQVVASAIYALGEIQCIQAINPLIEFLGNDDSSIRKNTIEALSKIGNPSISGLIKALEDTNWEKRNSAINCLNEMANNKLADLTMAISPILKKLSDNNPIVRSSAAIALGKIHNAIKNKTL